MDKRSYSKLDRILMQIERGLSTLCAEPRPQRPNPAADMAEPMMTDAERRASGAMMRVNHSGEICAQALYFGQMVMARSPHVRETLAQAAEEETDHLAWTAQRLQELSSHRSYLNLFWYSNAYLLGLLAGMAGDRWSLGFIEETERQVSRHLEKHLRRISPNDTKSRIIIAQMREDEQRHGQKALHAGAAPLPKLVKCLMSCHAKIMTLTAAKL